MENARQHNVVGHFLCKRLSSIPKLKSIPMLNENPKILTILFFSLPRHDTAKAVGEP